MAKTAIDAALVRSLVAAQFPQWSGLPVRELRPGGWDNRTFRLGDDMVVRLPSAAEYAAQVEKEARWLARLAPCLPLAIPEPLAIGEPADAYPWRWAVYRWIEGDIASPRGIADLDQFASDLARFLAALQRIDVTGGPAAGPHNFHRGGPLATYDAEARESIRALGGRIDGDAAMAAWEEAVSSPWNGAPT